MSVTPTEIVRSKQHSLGSGDEDHWARLLLVIVLMLIFFMTATITVPLLSGDALSQSGELGQGDHPLRAVDH
jgi:hypothetical protein